MTIKEKIIKFVEEKGLTHAEIGRRFHTSQQNVSRFLGEKGKVPLDFVIWLKTEFPEIDLEKLLLNDVTYNIVSDRKQSYDKSPTKKEQALAEIGNILDKYM